MDELEQAIKQAIFAARRVRSLVQDINGWCGDNFDIKHGVTDEVAALERAIEQLKAVAEKQPSN